MDGASSKGGVPFIILLYLESPEGEIYSKSNYRQVIVAQMA